VFIYIVRLNLDFMAIRGPKGKIIPRTTVFIYRPHPTSLVEEKLVMSPSRMERFPIGPVPVGNFAILNIDSPLVPLPICETMRDRSR
jgi:hypothetical protein